MKRWRCNKYTNAKILSVPLKCIDQHDALSSKSTQCVASPFYTEANRFIVTRLAVDFAAEFGFDPCNTRRQRNKDTDKPQGWRGRPISSYSYAIVQPEKWVYWILLRCARTIITTWWSSLLFPLSNWTDSFRNGIASIFVCGSNFTTEFKRVVVINTWLAKHRGTDNDIRFTWNNCHLFAANWNRTDKCSRHQPMSMQIIKSKKECGYMKLGFRFRESDKLL